MPRVNYVEKAQQRYEMVPVLDGDGNQVRTETSRRTRGKPGQPGRPVTRRQTRPDPDKPLPPRTCDSCRKPIEIGTPYKWIAPKSGPYGGRKMYRHKSCPTWFQWEYSDSLGAQLARVEHDFSQALGGAESEDDVQSALDEAAEAVREIAEAKREAAQNIEDGFQHPTSQSEELGEMADQLENWANEIESAEIPSFPEPEETDCGECDATGNDPGVDPDADDVPSCEACSGTGQVTPDEPTEDQVSEWRDDLESSLTIVGEPPV